jgi:1-aminocyclopropane-1-carboxylate synthase
LGGKWLCESCVSSRFSFSLHTQKHGHGFHSVIQILGNDLGNDVHFLWAVSKDFGASGLRVGIVYSQNEIFMQGLATANIFTCVSQPIQYLVSELWTDDQFLDHFLDESRHRILISYHICIAKLQEMVVPFVPASAGIFVYVDFSSLLPEKTYEGEQKLCKLMFEYARIVLTPGESQRDPRPGMFRICYAWVAPAVLAISMERMSRLVAKIRKLDWSDLNERSLHGVIHGS